MFSPRHPSAAALREQVAVGMGLAERTMLLRGGIQIPAVGLGLWKSKPGEVGAAVRSALEVGVRLLDGAAAYENEREVGDAIAGAIRDGVVSRDEIFVVSKLPNTHHVWGEDRSRVDVALAQTLKDLQVDYLDLYLMHWPFAFQQTDVNAVGGLRLPNATPNPKLTISAEFVETYREMIKLLIAGKCRAIGVCNFTQEQLEALMAAFPDQPPSVNQCELHPYLAQRDLKAFCDSKGIVMMAYSPLGSGDSYSGRSFPAKGTGPFENPGAGSTLLQNAVVAEIATRVGKSPAQVLLRWSVQRGTICIPKSVKAERIQQNAAVFDWGLSPEDLALLDGLDCGFRYGIGWAPGHYDCPNAPWWRASAAAAAAGPRKRPAACDEAGPVRKKPAART